jgi:predicted DNA-binding ribbon-helix-helix protein
MTISRLVNRNVVAERGRTSMRLEPELWDMLSEICEREAQDMSTLVRQIEAAGHAGPGSRSLGTLESADIAQVLDFLRFPCDRISRKLQNPRHTTKPIPP